MSLTLLLRCAARMSCGYVGLSKLANGKKNQKISEVAILLLCMFCSYVGVC